MHTDDKLNIISIHDRRLFSKKLYIYEFMDLEIDGNIGRSYSWVVWTTLKLQNFFDQIS